jgi:hypothetical protein
LHYLLILTPCCFTVKVRPAIVTVPVRRLAVVFAEMAYTTVPLPEPLMPDLMVIQEALLVAVQAQPLWVATLTDPVPAEDLKLLLEGAME